MEQEDVQELLTNEYSMTRADAEKAEKLLHPEAAREVWLVLTDRMLEQLGWIEYDAGWDCGGEMEPPLYTGYDVLPDRPVRMGTDPEDASAEAFFAQRMEETIWRLYFDDDGEPEFSCVYEADDGVSRVQVFKILKAED